MGRNVKNICYHDGVTLCLMCFEWTRLSQVVWRQIFLIHMLIKGLNEGLFWQYQLFLNGRILFCCGNYKVQIIISTDSCNAH